MSLERSRILVTFALVGATSLVIIGAIASREVPNVPRHIPEPTTEKYAPGVLVSPQPEGVTMPTESSHDGEPLLTVISIWGDTYQVKRIYTGQYEIIFPEPKVLSRRYLRPEDIKSFQ